MGFHSDSEPGGCKRQSRLASRDEVSTTSSGRVRRQGEMRRSFFSWDYIMYDLSQALLRLCGTVYVSIGRFSDYGWC